METIDIIIVAGVSFLLVVGGLFFGMFVARRTEAARVARLEEREERLLAMRAKFEHERFAVAASNGTGDVELDEDLFRGIKEEIEQERMELDMRREELELDLKMLEEENERLKSGMTGRSPAVAVSDDASDEAIIIEETDADVDAIDALGDIGAAQSPPAPSDPGQDVEDAVFEEADADEVIARNTIFGDFYFERDGDGLSFDADSPDEADEEADEEAEPVAPESAAQDDADEESVPAAQNDIDENSAATSRNDGDAEPAEPDDTDEEEIPAAQDDADEEEIPVAPDDADDDGWFSEPDVIRDRASSHIAIQERVGGDGAPARPRSGERSEPVRPAFDHMLTAQEEKFSAGSIQQILGLSDSDVALMNDLGYGTFRSIADLTNDEIARLAETFDVPETRIREEWIPDSRLRMARESRS